MGIRHVVALCRIGTSDPAAGLQFTGEYDHTGCAVLKKKVTSILPGTVFTMDESDPDLASFIDNEAVRFASDAEVEDGAAAEQRE
jgi:hypothetical protein